MNKLPSAIWEDDQYVYVPEELFELLPREYREAAEMRKQQDSKVLQVADEDIQNLIRLSNALQTTASLSYMYQRLRAVEFDKTTEWFMEHEMLTTAFVVTYSRLFVSGKGGSGVSRDQVPVHLREIHDDLIEVRHQRYAHNGGHESIGTGLKVDIDDAECRVSLEMKLGFYVGGRNEWADLVTFLHALMHDRLQKILRRLKEKTGYEWKFPVGPAPDWKQSPKDEP